MAKAKAVSINAFDKIEKDTYKGTESFEWHGVEVVVKKTLSIKEVLEFVNDVVKTCFSADDGSYIPEVKDFAVKSCILEKYANFSLPTNIEHKYDLIYHTDAIDEVLRRVNGQQFNEIIASINAKISHLASANIEAINKQMNELYTAFDNLQKQLEAVFSGIDPSDLTKLVGALGDKGINEEKIVKAYINQKTGEA